MSCTYSTENLEDFRCDDAAVDAVGIFAVVRSKASGDKTVFVRQYRPPMRGYTIEFPAGLVDAGETLEQGRRVTPLRVLLHVLDFPETVEC